MKQDLKILVVDDDMALADSLVDILDELGHRAETAGSGEEAVEKTSGDSFDYVLMDIMLPKMNGVEAFKEIKKNSPDTKVVLITGYSVDDLIREGLQEGVEGVLFKPFEVDSLLEFLKK